MIQEQQERKKSENQLRAEKLAKEAEINVRLAKRIMANMTRQRRTFIRSETPVKYERHN